MEQLAHLVIAAADLVEAEGRSLRSSIVRLAVAAALALAAALVGLMGVGFLMYGLYALLALTMSAPNAALIFGISAVALAAGLVLWARSYLT